MKKHFYLLILIFSFLNADAQDEVIISKKDSVVSDSIDIEKFKEEKLPFILVEKKPIFPGCEARLTDQEKDRCFQEKIQRFVANKFNTDLAAEHDLSGKLRILTSFTITKEGLIEIDGIRAPHPVLKEEAKRVLNLLPEMKPAMQRGKNVAIKFALPIIFMVEE